MTYYADSTPAWPTVCLCGGEMQMVEYEAGEPSTPDCPGLGDHWVVKCPVCHTTAGPTHGSPSTPSWEIPDSAIELILERMRGAWALLDAEGREWVLEESATHAELIRDAKAAREYAEREGVTA